MWFGGLFSKLRPKKTKKDDRLIDVNRIAQLDPARATGKAKRLFDEAHAKLGVVPNLLRVLGNSPAALEGYLHLDGALAGGSLSAKVREQIALTVAESNICGYCLSAHASFGEGVGLTERDVADARRAIAPTVRIDALLKLARNIVVQRGEIGDADLERARACGLTDAEIVETIANVALNILTNYVSHVARILVDFPEVKPGQL
jgi:uncharacterized peroxidase-related enzyme